MLRHLYIVRLLSRQQKAQASPDSVIASAVVVPDLGPLNNSIRLAQYHRKKAIKTINPSASFPLAVYA